MGNDLQRILKNALANLNDEQRKDHDECIAEGYKDEFCPKCGELFLANVHFVRCYAKDCPMSNGKTLLDMWKEQIEKDADETVS